MIWNKKKLKEINNNLNKALKETANEIIKDAKPPEDTGNLKNNVSIKDNGKGVVTIEYLAEYSARQYFHPEYNHKKGSGEWLETYISGAKKNFAINTFKKKY